VLLCAVATAVSLISLAVACLSILLR
jgi:hypothetical protein